MIESVFAACAFLCATSWLALAAHYTKLGCTSPVMNIRTMAFFATAIAIVVVASRETIAALPELTGLACAIVCTFTDLATGYVFDRVTIPAAAGAAIAAIMCGHGVASITGLACGYTTICLLWLITGRRGIGLGDAKLAAALGAAGSAGEVLYVMGGAFVLGALFASFGLATGRLNRGSTVRFAPFLATAFFAVLTVTRIQQ